MDIDSHYKGTSSFPHSYYRNESDLVNWAHEMTHAIAGEITSKNLGQRYGFYLTKNKAIVFDRSLQIDVRKVKQSIPEAHKKSTIWSTYMKDPRFITDERGNKEFVHDCEFILDELIAYTNGSETRQELNLVTREGSAKGAYEFTIYALYMIENADKTHPEYQKLIRFFQDTFHRNENSLLTDTDRRVRIEVLARDPETLDKLQTLIGYKLDL